MLALPPEEGASKRLTVMLQVVRRDTGAARAMIPLSQVKETVSSGHASFQAKMSTPVAVLGIRTEGDALAEIKFLPLSSKALAPQSRLAVLACAQIGRYLADPGFHFDLPLARRGTEFQRRVWAKIAAIGPGRTRSYGELARELRSAPRAVGQACGENPFPLIVPCHRVVAAAAIGGFAHSDDGFQLSVKRWLLSHEGAVTVS